jgi:hypothetical protein
VPDWGKFVAGACLPDGANLPADAFKARFDGVSGWCAMALATAGAGHPLGRKHAAEVAEAAVDRFLGQAGERAALEAFDANRDLLKEWRRAFAGDPEGSGRSAAEAARRRDFKVDAMVSGAFGDVFRRAGPGCSALLFAAARKLTVCWVCVTLRAGPGEAAVLGAMVPGGKATGPLVSPVAARTGSPFADASAAGIGSLVRVSLPVSFDGVVLASAAASARWVPGGTADAWGAWWDGPFRQSARVLFDSSSGLSDRARSLAGSLSSGGPGRGLAAAVLR